MKKIDLLEILKRCSFSGDKPVTDAQLAIWFSDHKKINPTTIQKMRKGERICSFGQTSFRFAFTNAAACFNEDYSFVSRINNILFDLNERGVISDYATYYKPLYEKFQRTVEIDAYARIEYVSAIVQRAFIDSPGEKRALLSPYECVDDIISVLQKDNRSARVFKLNNDSFCIEADYTIHEDFKGKLSFYIMEDRIICCTTNLLKVNRTYEILDLICELNSFPSPTAFTISINKDNMVSMYYIINSCEVPGLRCKNVIEEAEATVCTILLRISRKTSLIRNEGTHPILSSSFVEIMWILMNSLRIESLNVFVKLDMDHTPVLSLSGPLFCDVLHGQIEHLEQTVIRGENILDFGHLPELTVEAFNCVGGIVLTKTRNKKDNRQKNEKTQKAVQMLFLYSDL